MKFLREPRITDFYDQDSLEDAGLRIWNSIRETCTANNMDFDDIKHTAYINNYIIGFGRCLGMLHTVKPAGAILGRPWPDEFSEAVFAREFDRWEAESRIKVGLPHKFADGFGDGVQDGVAFFCNLPFANKAYLTNDLMEPFTRLKWAIRQKAVAAKK